MLMRFSRNSGLLCLLWLGLVLAGLLGRTYFPIDETRYATVAWNMWKSGDFLVPTLNGIPYSHKPPLLFWLMNLGWKIFGINDWWPRLIPSLFALGSVWFTRLIARELWPQQPNITENSALILMSSALWVAYSTALMFDMMIAFFSVMGIYAVLRMYKTPSQKGSWLLAFAIGGGLLAKGPTILLQILPVTLFVSWWHVPSSLITSKPRFREWHLPLIFSVIGGVLIALLWAIPAAYHGGEAYRQAIFWGQTAHRMVNSFAHKHPFWWYLYLAPALLFPWLFWGTIWQGAFKNRQMWQEFGTRFCLSWFVPVFIAYSLISGKQVHYVLPLFPVIALLVARFAENCPVTSIKSQSLIILALIGLGGLLIYLPHYVVSHRLSVKNWIHLPLWPGLIMISFAGWILWHPDRSTVGSIRRIAVIATATVALSLYTLIHTAGEAYDIRPVSDYLRSQENRQIPLAFYGKYHGTFDFVGKLQHSPTVIESPEQAAQWFNQHIDGQIITLHSQKNKPGKAMFLQSFKGQYIAVMTQSQWLATTAIVNNNVDD